jgi:DNA polymerase-3 subunit delta'
MRLSSQVIISNDIGESIIRLENLRTDEQIVEIVTPQVAKEIEQLDGRDIDGYSISRVITEREAFRIEDSKIAIEKAYISSEVERVIILASREFSPIIQNRLLKVIEEPPTKVSFILLTLSKSTILPTIRSRLPIKVLKQKSNHSTLGINLYKLDLKSVYSFIQDHKRINHAEAKILVEKISIEAMRSQRFNLDSSTLQLFQRSFMALDVGSPPQFVLTTLLLKLLAKNRR